jgi:serine/threonine-protein kinase
VRVTPFADVFVDGRLVGTTPLKPIELTAGPHQLLLVNSRLDVHKTVSVTVEAGRKLRVTELLSR